MIVPGILAAGVLLAGYSLQKSDIMAWFPKFKNKMKTICHILDDLKLKKRTGPPFDQMRDITIQNFKIMSLIRFKNSALPSLVDGFFNREASDLFDSSLGQMLPAVNIADKTDSFEIEVAAPGLKKENFQVNLHQHTLTIGYSEDENQEDQTGKYTRREFKFRSFKRSFSLPQTIDFERISASYVDGILHLSLPKREEAKARPERLIEIN